MNRSGIFGSNSSSGSLYSGSLTVEQKQKWDRQFDVADTNGDGVMDAAEGQVREHAPVPRCYEHWLIWSAV
jgi:hypothetical protein